MQKQQKTQLSKERIINAAITEFGANGYKKGALNNICAMGIPKGLLYHNFHSKDELYLQVVERAFDLFDVYIEQRGADRDVKSYLEARLGFLKEHSDFCRILFEALIQPPPKLAKQIKRIRTKFDDLNDRLYFGLIDQLSLREGVSKEEAENYFHIVQDMFNGYFANMLFSGVCVEEIAGKHEEILPKFIEYMIYGIVADKV
ncbi:MAG: TetR/AcrR family transcriptional regulator [Eubacteriales bacterium]|nr:TetR/AcrR family transcriptional regulator [Eubacteriales bacterium]